MPTSELYLYHAKKAVDLKELGLIKLSPEIHLKRPFDWNSIFNLISLT